LSKPENLVEVYRARNEMEAQVIKSLLAGYDIPCVFRANAAPSVHMFTYDGLAEVRVFVPASLEKDARELIVKE
jgi:hypothetical protein